MTDISTSESAAAIVALIYITALTVYAFSTNRMANALFENVRTSGPESIRKALAGMTTVKDALRDPEGRWRKFIRSGDYKKKCSSIMVADIDRFRARVNWGMGILVIIGILVFVVFWPVLRPGAR